MTGIIVDVFKDEVFVFADGRCTEDDIIYTDFDYKIHKLDSDNIVTMTGDDQIIDPTIELIWSGKVSLENLKQINGEGNVIWVHKDKLIVLNFDQKETPNGSVNSPGMSSYRLTSAPFFFGSGTGHLQGSYYARNPSVSSTKEKYIEEMEMVYSAAAKRITSMGVLRQHESIKLSKPKRSKRIKETDSE